MTSPFVALLHATQIGKIERSEVDPSATRLGAIAQALKTTVAHLLGEKVR